jgi:hypothetical protein
MTALVAVNPQLHRCRNLGYQWHVKNYELWIGRSVIVEIGVYHGPPLAAAYAMAVDHQLTSGHDRRTAAGLYWEQRGRVREQPEKGIFRLEGCCSIR